MSKADYNFAKHCEELLMYGYSDETFQVRPRWTDDNSPAHTKKLIHVVDQYDLQHEYPLMTLSRIAVKSAMDEILWIYQKKSNNVNDLKSHIWDEWADESGSIGKAYGYQMAQVHHYPQGDFTQIDKVIWDLKNDPGSRSIMTNLYNHADLSEMHLRPCAYSMTYSVTEKRDGKRYLNAILNQRSQDVLTANNWNSFQYAILLTMIAQVCDLIPGQLTHVISDYHVYDRHIPFVVDMVREYKLGVIHQIIELLDSRRRGVGHKFLSENDAEEIERLRRAHDYYFEHFDDAALSNIFDDFTITHLTYLAKKVINFVDPDLHVLDLMYNSPYEAPEVSLNPEIRDFYQFTTDDLIVEDYIYLPFNHKIPVAV